MHSRWGVPSPDDFPQFVADRVMSAIATRGMSVREVATISGINRTTLQGRINNVRPFTTAELEKVAKALGVSALSFFVD